MSDFEAVVRARRSTRGFTSRPVPESVVRAALELAQQSPSNCNAQPWRVVIATGERCRRLRARLLAAFDGNRPVDEVTTPRFEAEYRTRQVACAVELYGKMGVARGDRAARTRAERRNFELFDAPAVAIVCMKREFGVGVALDVGCWLQSFLLALTAFDVQSCPQASLRAYGTLVGEELGIDPSLQVLCGVSFGYGDESVAANAARMGRSPVDECVTLLGF
jgi:nitroreductase